MGIEASSVEVFSLRIGELRVGDVLDVVGTDVVEVELLAVVLGRDGQAPATGRVGVRRHRAGRAYHFMLTCPSCSSPVRVLHNDGAQGIGCRGCAAHRTRHQQQKRRLDYRQLGGREEDRLLRLLRTSNGNQARRRRARRLARSLAQADHLRVDVVVAEATNMLTAIADREAT